jgi:heme/copper-type cytochrome/quinol oxidase subunit 2
MRNRYSALLLLALPFAVAMVPAVAHSDRIIDVELSRSVMVPEPIAMRVGERVRLQVTSTDGTHACHVDGLGLDARIPAGGAVVAVDIAATQAGIFPIECIHDGDPARASTKGRFIVNPER